MRLHRPPPRTARPNRPARSFSPCLSLSLTLASALLLAPVARALEIHDVSVPPNAQVGAAALALNGAGTRYFLIFKVYVAALYLPRRTRSAAEALAMPGPKLLRLVMLRDVSGKELGDKLTEDIQNNIDPADFSRMITGLARMGGLFADRKQLHAGDVVELIDVPGRGMQIRIDGQPAGAPYTEPGFFDDMLKIWLGPRPAETRLKNALLGDASLAN